MQILKRTDSSNTEFIELVKYLDEGLAIIDGDQHDFYDQFNNIDVLKNVIVLYEGNQALGCGAFKEYEPGIVEIKRMYTSTNSRGKGVAVKVLTELEAWAQELGYTKSLLETGIKMPEAIGLYNKMGYQLIPNYGQYAGKELSRCFEKEL